MLIDKIIVYGAGAAGSNLLINLVCIHPEISFVAVDFDKIELRNITPKTQPYSKSDINRPKVQALQKILLTTYEKKIEILNKEIRGKSDFAGLGENTLLVDAFDNAKSRNLFIGLPYPVVHVGFSVQLTGEIAWDTVWTKMTESKADAKIDVCELHLAKPFIQSLTGIAAIVISEFIRNNKKTNVYFDSELRLRKF